MVALGKASPMDVTGEAGPLHSWAPNIIVLYPFVTGVQCAQLYCAYRLLHMAWVTGTLVEWYIPVAGVLFLVLGVGNLLATNDVYISKWRKHRSAVTTTATAATATAAGASTATVAAADTETTTTAPTTKKEL